MASNHVDDPDSSSNGEGDLEGDGVGDEVSGTSGRLVTSSNCAVMADSLNASFICAESKDVIPAENTKRSNPMLSATI